MHRTRELMLAAEAKAPLAILRLTAVYGAGDTHNSYGPNRFLRQALKDGRFRCSATARKPATICMSTTRSIASSMSLHMGRRASSMSQPESPSPSSPLRN